MKELYGNGYVPSIAQAIEEMKAEQGESFSPERINLAELERRTGISRGKLRRLKQNGFRGIPKGSDSGKHKFTKLTGYTGIIDTLLKQGVSNSTVILNRLLESGFEGRLTIVKDYIAAHKHLIPAKRQQIAPQGNRGRRYERDRKGSTQTTQEVEIYFNFVGRFVPPAFGEVELTPEELEEIRKREERKDRLHQNYLKRKASGAQKRYEDKIKEKKKAEIEAKKAAIRAEDIAKGVFVPVSQLPTREPQKGVQTP